MKRLPFGNCPYCDSERGIYSGWGMSPEGWAHAKDRHDAGHPEALQDKEEVKKHVNECRAERDGICICSAFKEEVKECKHDWFNSGVGSTFCMKCKKELKTDAPPIPEKLDFSGDEDDNVVVARKINEMIDYLTFITKKR